MRRNANMQALALATLPRNENRLYLAVKAVGEVTITISGGAPFTITDEVWAPLPAPSNDIVFVGTGTMILG